MNTRRGDARLRLLVALRDHGPCTQREASIHANVGLTYVSRTLKVLEEHDLVHPKGFAEQHHNGLRAILWHFGSTQIAKCKRVLYVTPSEQKALNEFDRLVQLLEPQLVSRTHLTFTLPDRVVRIHWKTQDPRVLAGCKFDQLLVPEATTFPPDQLAFYNSLVRPS